MTPFTAYDKGTGQVLFSGTTDAPELHETEIVGVLVDVVASAEQYVSDGALTHRPPCPSDSHDWDWTTKAWQPNTAAARAKKKAAIAAEQARRSVAPITYAGSPYDADATARERISGTLARLLRGDGLPAGWVGWRDYANAMHWGSDTAEVVQAHLAGLSAAIEDREQALLIAAWQHKAALDALTDIGDILSYDTTSNWPA